MADQDRELKSPDPPPFLEVTCNALGKPSRFAAGTRAGFAVSLISRKLLENGMPLVSHIDSVKVGEEPVSFGPDAVLVDYGSGWKLVTVNEFDHVRDGGSKVERMERIRPNLTHGFEARNPVKKVSEKEFSFLYIGKILMAFILIFVLGAILTFALENLPGVILFLNSFM